MPEVEVEVEKRMFNSPSTPTSSNAPHEPATMDEPLIDSSAASPADPTPPTSPAAVSPPLRPVEEIDLAALVLRVQSLPTAAAEFCAGQFVKPLLARLRAAEEALAVGDLAAQQSMMISGSYPADLSEEAHLWRRCAKAGEEHGEVIEALLGLVGENPRKGVTADREKVIKELLDEAFAALGAVEHLRGNDGSSGRLLAEHAVFVTTRLRAALAEGASR